jgi:hypothetical protein
VLHELLYTSVPRGLRANATGYCTVAHTTDLGDDLIKRLEGLSRYRHLVKGADPVQNNNPVVWAHTRLDVGYRTYHALSRIGDTGFDHTNRSNYLAHHVVLGDDGLPASGPAWLLRNANWFRQEWPAGQMPEVYAPRLRLPSGSAEPTRCVAWECLTGDAGWAGVLAAANSGTPAYVVYAPGQDVLPLLVEALALLDPAERWQVTFSTFYTGVTAGTTCQWRFVVAGSDEAKEALQARRGVVLRLDQAMSGSPEGALVDAARTGIVPRAAQTTPVAPLAPTPAPRKPTAAKPVVRPAGRISAAPIELPTEPVELEMPEPTMARSGMSVFALLLGLLLGGLLMALAGGLFEVAAGRSVLQLLGQISTSERELSKKNEELAAQAERTKQTADDQRANAQAQLRDAEADLRRVKQELETAKAAAATASEEAKKEKQRVEQLTKENSDLEKENKKLKEKPTDPKPPKPVDPKPVEPKPEVKKPAPAKPKEPTVEIHESALTVSLESKEVKNKDLFKVPHTGKIKLAAYGLPQEIKAEYEEEGAILKLSRPGEPKFAVVLTADALSRQVSLSGFYSENAFPYLGLVVIKASSEGHPPHYQQLFKCKEVPQLDLLCEQSMPKGEATYTSLLWPDKVGHFATPLANEIRTQPEIVNTLGFSQSARLRLKVDGKDKDLSLSIPKTMVEFPVNSLVTANKKEGEWHAELTLKEGKLQVKLSAPDDAKLPTNLKLHEVAIGRPIAELKVLQPLLRIK